MTSRPPPLVLVAQLAKSSADLDAHELAILWALAGRADREGRCWPSVETLGTDARLSERTARGTVGKLAQRGLVGVTRQRAAGRQGTSHYSLDLEQIGRLAAEHPRVRAVPAVETSVHTMPADSMHAAPAVLRPDCTPRRSSLQDTSLQPAHRAADLSHDRVHDLERETRAHEPVRLTVGMPMPARVRGAWETHRLGHASTRLEPEQEWQALVDDLLAGSPAKGRPPVDEWPSLDALAARFRQWLKMGERMDATRRQREREFADARPRNASPMSATPCGPELPIPPDPVTTLSLDEIAKLRPTSWHGRQTATPTPPLARAGGAR